MRTPPATIAWIVIVLSALGIAIGQSRLDADTPSSERGELAILELQARILRGVAELRSGLAREQLPALHHAAHSAALARAVAAVEAGFPGADGPSRRRALDLLDRLGDDSDVDHLLARAIRNPNGVAPSERERLRQELGWFGRVVLSPADAGDAARVRHDGLRALIGIGSLASLALLAVLTGVGLLLAARVRRDAGTFPTRFTPPGEHAGVYLEAFAVYLAIFFLVVVAPALTGADLPALVGIGLVAASLAGAAWPLVRGVPLGVALRDLGLHRGAGVARELVAGAVGYVAILPVFAVGFAISLGAVAVADRLGGAEDTSAPISHPIVEMLVAGDATVALMVLLLASGFAPFFEELMFRGALYGPLRRSLGPIAAGLASGVVFAAIHPQGWLMIPALASLALGFALVREWRGSLLAPMAAHAVHNGVLVIVLWTALR